MHKKVLGFLLVCTTTDKQLMSFSYTNSAYGLNLSGGLIAFAICILAGSGKSLSIVQVILLGLISDGIGSTLRPLIGVMFVDVGVSGIWDKGRGAAAFVM